MSFRTGSFLFCLCLLPLAGRAGVWTNAQYGVAIDAFPAGWKTRPGTALVRLEKEFNKDGYGYAYDESITFSISLGQSQSLDGMAEDLARQGYSLQERSRVRLGDSTLPLWIFFHQASAQEVSWVALVLRSGLAYSFEVRGTPLDRALLEDFKQVIGNFRFLPDTRQDAWNAIESGDPGRAYRLFGKLVGDEPADGNALYGLGLAELALGKSTQALAHLRKVNPMLGFGEARQALGQAYLQTGDPVRAVATWCEIIRDNPGEEAELEPYISDALAAARRSDRALTPERKLVWEDFIFLAATAASELQDGLMDARSGDFPAGTRARYEFLHERSELLTTGTLEHLIAQGGAGVEAHFLAAAFVYRKALGEAIEAMKNSDAELLERAGLRLREALAVFATASGPVEETP